MVNAEEEQVEKRARLFGLAKRQIITRPKTLIGGTIFGKVTGVGRPSSSLTKRDQLKILRFKNKLEKAKLRNALERYKLLHKIQIYKQQGKLKPALQMLQQPMITQRRYPIFSSPMEQRDLDSGFDADINHGDKSLWGDETYYDENFYSEDFYGNEFYGDPLMQLGIKIRQGVSPLLW